MPNWIERKCSEHGLRMTEQRRVIAQVLSDADDQFTEQCVFFQMPASSRPMISEMAARVMKPPMKIIMTTLLMFKAAKLSNLWMKRLKPYKNASQSV